MFKDTTQIAIVVRDLYQAMETYVEEYGIGPWEIFNFNPETGSDMVVHDEPVDYSMRVAMAMVGNVQWELIEPLDDSSIYAEFLESHGGGLHHVCVTVNDYDDALATLRSKGHSVLQAGSYKGATFAYVSTDRDLGVITEIVDEPSAAHIPDSTYP